MKFYINSKTFKNAVERAAIICPKKSALPYFYNVTIEASENGLTFQTFNGEEYAEIALSKSDVAVEECGKVAVDCDDLKKILNVTGELVVETNENTIKVKNDKKQSAVSTRECVDTEFNVSDKVIGSFDLNAGKLLDIMGNLECCLGGESYNAIMSCYHFTDDRIETLDSHRIGFKKVNWDNTDGKLNINVPGFAYKSLKKIVDDKNDYVLGRTDDRKVEFIGRDYRYICKLVDGIYFDTDRMIGNFKNASNYQFETDADEILAISKEYAKCVKAEKKPMIFSFLDGEAYSMIMTSDYATSDKLNVKGNLPDNFNIGINPQYVKEAVEVFSGDITVELQNEKAPMCISKDEYMFVILPVNVSADDIDKYRNFLVA